MQITGANDVDIMLDEDGQPVSDGNGDTALVSDDECWLQDIKNEAMTEEGELFYEDEEGDASYGWSLLDFMQGEYDDFTQMEIQQRIRSVSQIPPLHISRADTACVDSSLLSDFEAPAPQTSSSCQTSFSPPAK